MERTRQPRDRGFRQKRKREKKREAADRWERSMGNQSSSNHDRNQMCRPQQHTEDGEREGREGGPKRARRRLALIEDDMVGRKNEKDTDRERGNRRRQGNERGRQTKGKEDEATGTDFLP